MGVLCSRKLPTHDFDDKAEPIVRTAGSLSAVDLSTPIGKPFPKRPFFCNLSKKAWAELEELFYRIDVDGSNAVSRVEAMEFFKGKFGRISMEAMFSEVDEDGSGAITAEEFAAYWQNVRRTGYSEQDILDEVSEILNGAPWVAWKETKKAGNMFPTRPKTSRLSAQSWAKIQELFRKIDSDQTMTITPEKAKSFFKMPFAKLSADAMFNEIDQWHHGHITAKDFFDFWEQVRSSGYSDKDIQDELATLIEGGSWVDWDDRRSTVPKRRTVSQTTTSTSSRRSLLRLGSSRLEEASRSHASANEYRLRA